MPAAAPTGPAVEAGDPPRPRNRLGHRPALDGLRGAGLAVVLLYHGGVTWFPGSFLAVSMFFTLSGFLITRLLLEERSATGGTGIAAFYGRRVKRLVPASAVTLFLVTVAAWAGWFEGVADLRRDLVGAALQVANWTRLTSSRSYHDLFLDGVSPVEHYWSLAIEEQLYVVWPLVFALAARGGPRTVRRVVLGGFAVLTAVAVGVAVLAGPDAAYLATPARAPEVLAGACLAVLLDLRRPPRNLPMLAVASALGMLVLVVVTPFDHGWAYEGGLPFFGILSAVTVGGAVVDGPVRRVLSWRPFVVLGVLSYAAYLVHWPVYVLVDLHAGGLDDPARLALKLAATFALVVPLHRLVEQPLRHAPLRRGTIAVGLGALATVAAVAALAAPAPLPRPGVVPAERAALVDLAPLAEPAGPLVDADGRPLRPLRLLVVGDSTARGFGFGLTNWAIEHPGVARVRVTSVDGCGFLAGGKGDNLIDFTRERCDEVMGEVLPEELRTLRPDVVVLSNAGADVFPRRWDDGPLRPTTDPEVAGRLRAAYDAFFDRVADAGIAHVAWIRPAVADDPEDRTFEDGSHALVEAVVRGQEARHPGLVTVVDFRSWFEAEGLDRQPIRPDGVHLLDEPMDDVVRRFLAPELLRLAGVRG